MAIMHPEKRTPQEYITGEALDELLNGFDETALFSENDDLATVNLGRVANGLKPIEDASQVDLTEMLANDTAFDALPSDETPSRLPVPASASPSTELAVWSSSASTELVVPPQSSSEVELIKDVPTGAGKDLFNRVQTEERHMPSDISPLEIPEEISEDVGNMLTAPVTTGVEVHNTRRYAQALLGTIVEKSNSLKADEETVYNVALAISEFLGNSIRHGEGAVCVVLGRTAMGHIFAAVVTRYEQKAKPASTPDDIEDPDKLGAKESGRGLSITTGLSVETSGEGNSSGFTPVPGELVQRLAHLVTPKPIPVEDKDSYGVAWGVYGTAA